MDDIIKKYKQERKIKNIIIIASSFLLALWLNFFLMNSNTSSLLQSSVLNSNLNKPLSADLFFTQKNESGNTSIELKNGKKMYQVQSLSFSTMYNPENMQLKDKFLQLENAELLNLVDNDGYNTVIVNFKTPTDIPVNTNIINFIFEKTDTNILENAQLINANMTDKNGDVFNLSTSWINF